MRYRLRILTVGLLLILSLALSACGEDKQAKDSEDSTALNDQPATLVSETTVVLETTSEGGVIEQDPDGNKITKNSDGKVTKVEDKNGKPIDVTEYLETHRWVENSAPDNSGAGSSDNSSSKKPDDPSPQKPDNGTQPAKDEEVEGEIPVIIATIPDEEELIELPDL